MPFRSLLVVLQFVAIAASQATFGDDFGLNATKLSNDIIFALRDELRTFQLRDFIIDNLRNEFDAFGSRLRTYCNGLADNQADNGAFNAMLGTLILPASHVQAIVFTVNDTKAFPPVLKVLNTNITYSLVNPQGALANLLYASHLYTDTNRAGGSQRRQAIETPHSPARSLQDFDILASTNGKNEATTPNIKRGEDLREPALFYTMLSVVILYIVVLLCLYFKKTADAQLRLRPKTASKNASIEYWRQHREEEREKKARKELKQQRQQSILEGQQQVGADRIRGMVLP